MLFFPFSLFFFAVSPTGVLLSTWCRARAALAELGGAGGGGVGGNAAWVCLSREPRVTMRAPSPSNLGARALSTQCPPASSPGTQANAGILGESDAEVARPLETAR